MDTNVKELLTQHTKFKDKNKISLLEFKAWLAGFMMNRNDIDTMPMDDVVMILSMVAKITDVSIRDNLPLIPSNPIYPNVPWSRPEGPSCTPMPKPLDVWYSITKTPNCGNEITLATTAIPGKGS